MVIAKDELLSSILEIEDQDAVDLDGAVKHTHNAQEKITLIKTYKSIRKSNNKPIVNIRGNQ